MKRSDEKWAVAEVGDMMGKPRHRVKPKRCKFKGCKTILNSYHDGKYCHVHGLTGFLDEDVEQRLIN